jgi:acetoin utilization deacetylase AcuC-like enzyme
MSSVSLTESLRQKRAFVPAGCYPYFSGYAHDRGKNAGVDTTMNIPLVAGADDAAFTAANALLADALQAFGAKALVLSAGWDAHGREPLSPFKVTDDGFRAVGALFAALNLPMVIVQEGGYNLDRIRTSLAAFFAGFQREQSGE